MKFHVFALFFAASAIGDEITFEIAESPKTTFRELQFENDSVRVWKTTIMPKSPLKMHRHEYSRVIVGLDGGTLRKVTDRGEESFLSFDTGKATWHEADPAGELHADVNESNDPIVVMVIELKNSLNN